MASLRKRQRLNARAPQDIASQGVESKQQTISQLFFASATLQKQLDVDPLALSPSTKRKRGPLSQRHDPSPPKSPTSANMYSFCTKANGGAADHSIATTTAPRSKQRRVSVGAKVENAPTAGGPRRLAVRNLRPQTKPHAGDYVQRTTAQLTAALSAILSNGAPALSSEELYRGAENLCKLGHAADLAQLVTAQCEAHISSEATKVNESFRSAGDDVQVVRLLLHAWDAWSTQMLAVRGIFFYLDRTHLSQSNSLSLYDRSLSLFRNHLLGQASSRSRTMDGACDLLLAERNGNTTDRALFASTVKMFHDLQIYTSDFEPRMLAVSQTWIVGWSDENCASRELIDYVDAARVLMDTEMLRCKHLDLDGTTRRELLALLEDHCIMRKLDELTNNDSIADVLDNDVQTAANNLKQLFETLQMKQAGVRLKEPFSKWLEDTGTAIIFDEKDQDQMVVRLLEFKQKLDHIWRKSFNKHEELGHALRSTFEKFMNKSKKSSATWNTDNSRTGEMIAKYVDGLLRAGAKAIQPQVRSVGGVKPPRAFKRVDEMNEPDENAEMDDDDEFESQLDQVLDLFRFVHGKAVFEAFYKKDLARRLLLGRSASNDAEKNMLERLKTECGAGFTHNLEQMFKDIELADDEAKAYKNRFVDSDRSRGVDLSVSVLSSAAWPSYPDVPVAVPRDVLSSLDDYERFYHSKHSGRKLGWKHALAHCQMKADFPRGKKELVVSAFQAVVLLLFNGRADVDHLSFEHIKAESGLSAVEASRTLQSLACARLRPLTKHPRGRDICPTDTFTLNAAFSHDKYRVKINSIQLKETREENEETHVRVAVDRQFETQAAIVRILKEKKRVTHQQLIVLVIEKTRTRGVLQPAEIKKEIDKLIEKEYLERGEGNVYEYLA